MKKTIWWSIVIFGLALVAAIVYYAIPITRDLPQQEPPLPQSAEAPPPVKEAREPAIRYPIPQEPPEKPLPALDTSDATMRNALGSLWSDKAVEERFQLKDFIRRVVATIDNLPRRKIALQLMPVRPVDGSFLVAGSEESLAIAQENAARYAPYVRLLDAIDTSKLIALYTRFYALFQQAYVDLGYPNAYFNDRLIEVIDDLLEAPEPAPPVKLVRPKVFYLYADPDLEARSAGQKIMMRMGSGNAARVKASLRAIRAELVKHADTRSAR